jgi:hypothetical protein
MRLPWDKSVLFCLRLARTMRRSDKVKFGKWPAEKREIQTVF